MFRAEFSRNTFIVNFSASRARFLILPILGYRFAGKSYDQDTPFRASLPARGNGGPWPFRWFCSLPVIVRAAVARRLSAGTWAQYLGISRPRGHTTVISCSQDSSSICFSTIMCYQRQHQQQQQQHMGEKGGVIGALVGENSREKAWIIRE